MFLKSCAKIHKYSCFTNPKFIGKGLGTQLIPFIFDIDKSTLPKVKKYNCLAPEN